jgi:predicted transcriptional regulator
MQESLMSESTVVVRPDLKAELERLAAQTRRDQGDLANEALEAYLERENANLARIRAGLDQARRGEFATDAEVGDFFAKRSAPRA